MFPSMYRCSPIEISVNEMSLKLNIHLNSFLQKIELVPYSSNPRIIDNLLRFVSRNSYLDYLFIALHLIHSAKIFKLFALKYFSPGDFCRAYFETLIPYASR